MSITVEQLLAAAQVASTEPVEAVRRASVHQAYYALFHHTLCLANGYLSANISGGSQHKQLWHFMKGRRDQRFAIIGKNLERALTMRVRADYELDANLGYEEVLEHFQRCKEGLEQVDSFLTRFYEQPQP